MVEKTNIETQNTHSNVFENTTVEKSKKNPNTKKIVLTIIVAILSAVGILGMVKLSEYAEFSQLKKELCAYDFQIETQYDTAESCFEALLKLNTIQDENDTAINKEFSLDNDEEEMLKSYNDERFIELANQVLDNTTAKLEFSRSEIIETFTGHSGNLIKCVGEDYEESEYAYAFSAFLTFFRDEDYGTVDNIKYEYDCVYYICNTLYPKTFNQGIIDTFLSIGVSSWGSSGKETLEETISYVSSSPEGTTPYESYIATAKKQLDEKNAIEDSKPKNYCVECGAKASYSYTSPFSGLKEWYCYSCYSELQDLLDQFGMN